MTLVADTTPYPWPYDKVLEPSRTALIVCGTGEAWAARTPLEVDVDARISTLRTDAGRAGVLVVLLDEATPHVRGDADLPTPACAALAALPNESTITTAGTDGFYGSALDATLHRAGITHLLLAGRGFETCVHSTLRRANDRGYECLTIADACAPIDPSNRAASISSIEMSGGIFGAVGTTEGVRAALAATVPTPTPARLTPDQPQPLET